MISLELSSIQQKDTERAWLARAMADYEAGRVVEVVPISRSLFNPTRFNSESIQSTSVRFDRPSDGAPSPASKRNAAIKAANKARKKAFEDGIAAKLTAYLDVGLVEAAKALGVSQHRLSRIASENKMVFARSHEAERALDAKLAPQVREMCNQGMGQVEIAEALGVRRGRIRRISTDYKIRFGTRTKIEDELAIVAKIKALLPSGCTRRNAAEQIGITQKVLSRIVDQYAIDFPLRTTKPRKG
ncbi:hypothetical protein ASF66_00875 [Pseudomonas sp. Leaf129]|uniref:hypothetical protein n=1 Tax=Pseudomonas sp. Leaf129 TaxID=1736268 RepID=UPI00070329F1|nr:hypothetical protein [Pseudomonas sp. Leaf129]KQQ62939.1 hypothetical protein ASF66_00875 [Pseudomonas sp. Leaf129]